MPREQINYPGNPDNESPLVHIVWNAQVGTVQLAFEMSEEAVRKWLDDPSRLTDSKGTVWFYTEQLERSTLNKLIRSTRNARDKAYGRDE